MLLYLHLGVSPVSPFEVDLSSMEVEMEVVRGDLSPVEVESDVVGYAWKPISIAEGIGCCVKTLSGCGSLLKPSLKVKGAWKNTLVCCFG